MSLSSAAATPSLPSHPLVLPCPAPKLWFCWSRGGPGSRGAPIRRQIQSQVAPGLCPGCWASKPLVPSVTAASSPRSLPSSSIFNGSLGPPDKSSLSSAPPAQIIFGPHLLQELLLLHLLKCRPSPPPPGPWHLLTTPLGMKQTLFLPQGSSPIPLLL